MKPIDFFYLSKSIAKPFLAGFLICYASSATANPPSVTLNKSNHLVLTLSDKWLETNVTNAQNRQSQTQTKTDQLIANSSKSQNTKLGCGMDLSPYGSSTSSLESRVVGKCNFDYHY